MSIERVPVAVYAEDPISQTGVTCQLRPRPEVEVLRLPDEENRAVVSLVVVDRLDDNAIRLLRRLRQSGDTRTGLVVGQVEQNALSVAIECGVAAVIRRVDAGQDRLVEMIMAASRGEGVLPGDLLGRLLEQMGQLQRKVLDPRGLTMSALTSREIDVLQLISEGFDTGEIATKLCYSERTVKNVLYEVTTRLQLRNRAHAVAYVMRHGLI
ncbi:helix-turn-helix transcriptional regulator [Actinoalloteichus hymeniacidonis]|uniref:Transcriptional regulator, LuxR family n=1 Tax=Actinoalloteichus hymeniacidonis TaxID=340345 RepID=A0AAC9HRZ9_9PSEU|nr:response regulator transcription factor [Actinoalloteichus hymeniacidonis]AOS64315.1 transcriptional regulator, LuxR family [Actinoalloteichus hymeniacidonis]MBB5907617.1 DNA-binding NarL/FixJ family response regulator [Actinoalloteichus hymeniacidonis]